MVSIIGQFLGQQMAKFYF